MLIMWGTPEQRMFVIAVAHAELIAAAAASALVALITVPVEELGAPAEGGAVAVRTGSMGLAAPVFAPAGLHVHARRHGHRHGHRRTNHLHRGHARAA